VFILNCENELPPKLKLKPIGSAAEIPSSLFKLAGVTGVDPLNKVNGEVLLKNEYVEIEDNTDTSRFEFSPQATESGVVVADKIIGRGFTVTKYCTVLAHKGGLDCVPVKVYVVVVVGLNV